MGDGGTEALGAGDPPALHGSAIGETVVERLMRRLCEAALLVMLAIIGLDIVTRYLFHFSFEISDEFGAYMLVAMTFLSLSVCQVNGAFHRVELVQARLSPRGRALSDLVFDALALGFSLLYLYQLGRFTVRSWSVGDQAPTLLATPLWIPRLAMVLGILALCYSLARAIVSDLRRVRAPGEMRRA
jgi:TRAP-type transport system small permease protein